jgi:hypothetical protein
MYMHLREKSNDLKDIMVAIYKKRNLFVRTYTQDFYNLSKLYCSMKDDDMSKILKRTPIRNGSFIDLAKFIKLHTEKCKRHIIMERLRY